MLLPCRFKLFSHRRFLKWLLYSSYPHEAQPVTAASIKGVCGNKQRHSDTPVAAGPLVGKRHRRPAIMEHLQRWKTWWQRKLRSIRRTNESIEWHRHRVELCGRQNSFRQEVRRLAWNCINGVNWSILLKACTNKPKGPPLLFSTLWIQVSASKQNDRNPAAPC